MDFTILLDDLQKLTNKKVSLAKIGEILEVTRSNISKRAKSGSEVTVEELHKIENYYNINIYKAGCYNGERRFEPSVIEKFNKFGMRLSQLQMQHNFLDKEMAKILNIPEKLYISLVVGEAKPTIDVLNGIKQNFKVSIEYLLYGE